MRGSSRENERFKRIRSIDCDPSHVIIERQRIGRCVAEFRDSNPTQLL